MISGPDDDIEAINLEMIPGPHLQHVEKGTFAEILMVRDAISHVGREHGESAIDQLPRPEWPDDAKRCCR